MMFNIVISLLATMALVWAAVSDYKTREVPRLAGFGLLILGLVVLLLNSLWVEAIFLVLAVWCSSGGIWRFVLFLSSLAVLFIRGALIIPLVVGILFFLLMFWSGRLGGGDAQLALGLMAIGNDWAIFAFLSITTILVMFLLSVKKHSGLLPGIKRLFYVGRHLEDEPDVEAIHLPWAVVAMIAGILYFWVWPFFNGVGFS